MDKNSKASSLREVIFIAIAAILANLPTLLNRGFFSHDEWQKFDHLILKGGADFIREYGQLRAGPDFGFPVRPLGFLQQGFSAQFMGTSPFLVHAIDVAFHCFCAMLLFACLRALNTTRRFAFTAAIIFAISPLAAFSTGWVGASFDRWYVLFGLIIALGVIRAQTVRLDFAAGAMIFVGSAFAILSKETAVMMPVAAIILMYGIARTGRGMPSPKIAVSILALISIPIMLYLFVRLPALASSFSGHGGAYKPSTSNLISNVKLYFAQPFLLNAYELNSASLLPKWQWAVALALHFSLLIAIAWRRGALTAAVYLCAFFVFLLPVLPVPVIGAHYLYASGVAFSLGLASILEPSKAGTSAASDTVALIFGLVLIGTGTYHTIKIGTQFNKDGACQVRVLKDLDANILSAKSAGNDGIVIEPAFGAPDYIARRSVFSRHPYMLGRGFPVIFSGDPTEGIGNPTRLEMRPDCALSRK